MIDAVKPSTARAKLAASRAELLAAMGYENAGSVMTDSPDIVRLPPGPGQRSVRSGFAAKVEQSVVGRWWRHHPLSTMVELSRPLLETQARERPGRLVACAAATGSLLWLAKPWRLLSAATVVTLVLKSSEISRMVSGLASKARLMRRTTTTAAWRGARPGARP